MTESCKLEQSDVCAGAHEISISDDIFVMECMMENNGNGLLFHMTLLISRSNTKSHRMQGKPTVSEQLEQMKIAYNGIKADQCKQRVVGEMWDL